MPISRNSMNRAESAKSNRLHDFGFAIVFDGSLPFAFCCALSRRDVTQNVTRRRRLPWQIPRMQ
jgi:hypothetical protein